MPACLHHLVNHQETVWVLIAQFLLSMATVKDEGRASWDGHSGSYKSRETKEGEVGPWVLKENVTAEIGLGLGVKEGVLHRDAVGNVLS